MHLYYSLYTNIFFIALDEMHSSAVLSLFGCFYCQVAVGVGESDARYESAPAQTSPQQAEFGSDRPCVYRYSWACSYDK